MADETKNLEINVKIKIKKMPVAEYEAIMKPYKQNLLQFERSLRQLADQGIISYKILDEFTNKFKFLELQRMRFSTPEESQDFMQPQPMAQQQMPPQQPAGFNFGQSQQAPPQQTGQFGFGQSQQNPPASTGFGQATSRPQPSFGTNPTAPRPYSSGMNQPSPFEQQKPEPQSFKPPQSPQPTSGFSSFSDPAKSEPSFSPASAPANNPETAPAPTSTPSFGMSGNFQSSTPSAPKQDKISIGVDEEDRATGIAILRKKMLMELRKIRNVVEEQDDSSF